MKKYLISSILAVGLLFGNITANAMDKIVPQELTAKNTGNYHIVNVTAEKIFSDLIMRLDVRAEHIYELYNKHLVTLNNDKYKNPNYYYVKYKFAELVYSKNGKDLVEIRVEKTSNPKSYCVYDFPTGRLKYVAVYDDATREYFKYTPYGSLYNTRSYMSNLSLRVSRRLAAAVGTDLPKPVRVYMKVDSKGNLIDSKIQRSCGNEEFDARILESVKEGAPYDTFSQKFPKNLELMVDFGGKKRK